MNDLILEKSVVVSAPLDTVWKAWTTEEGLKFASPASRVDLRPGGDYAWFLDLEPDEKGNRGSEGSKIVSVDAPRGLVFDWTFPPEPTPTLRATGATTRVAVTLEDVESGTRVTLTATGWGEGEEWGHGYRYFDRAWDVVLEWLEESLA